jgi:septal ring factor EnvC (AmiA/AmiB activator)
VNKNELIALAGNTGGRAEPGLYFEIRENGKPLNPAKWCRG